MDPIDVTGEEEKALKEAWNCLGVLLSFAVRELGRDAGLALCAGLARGDLMPRWTIAPGRVFCEISRGEDVIYSFEFLHSPPRFAFIELGGQAN